MSILSLFTRNRRAQGQKAAELEQRWLAERLSSDSDNDRTPVLSTDKRGQLGYAGHTWTYVCINRIITIASTAPWAVLARGEEQADHPLVALINNPNPLLNDVRLFAITFLSLELWGNAYWEIVRGSKQQPVELWPVPADAMRIVEQERGLPKTFALRDGMGKELRYPAEDIVWFHYEGPGGALDSVPALSAAQQAIQTDIYALRSNLAYFQRGAKPGWALKTDSALTEEQATSLRTQFSSFYQGVGKWFRPVVLAGGIDLIKLEDSLDQTWLDLRVQLRQEILSAFGVPPAIVGIFEYAQFGVSIEQQRAMMWENCLMPRLEAVAADINRQLMQRVEPSGSSSFTWNYAQVSALQPDFTKLANAARMLTGGQAVLTVNEARQRLLGLDALTDEELAAMQPAQRLTDARLPIADNTTEDEPKKTAIPTVRVKVMRRLDEQQRKALFHKFNADRDAEIVRIKRTVATWYEAITDEVLQNIDNAAKARAISRVKAPNVDVLIFSERDATRALRERIAPVLQSILAATGQESIAQIGADLRFDVQCPRALELLRGRTQVMKTVVETAQQTVRESLAEGIANGETVEDLKARVLLWSATGKEHHAETVARTESGIVMNTAAVEAYRQGGAAGKEWLSILDDRTRPEHADMDGVVVGIDEKFILDGAECDGPGDPALSIEQLANCRCTVAPVIEM